MIRSFLTTFAPLVLGAVLLAIPVRSADLPAPEGPVLLTIRGVGDSPVELDRAALESLPRRAFATGTIWTEGVSTFEGVSLAALLARLDVNDGTLKATAVNDYSVELPVAEVLRNDPIIADRRDGQPMSLRGKGPLWIVYPYDSDPAFQTEIVYARSIWQLDRIEVLR